MKDNYSLFLDTTNNYCFIALYNNEKLLKKAKLLVNKNVTDIIVGTIDKLFKSAKVKKLSLNNIYLNVGPGGFTGLKVGVLVAKAWALVNPMINVYTCNSLLLQTIKLPAISVIDAKSKKVYLAVYSKTKTIVEPCLIDFLDLDAYLKKYSSYDLCLNKIDEMYDNFIYHKKAFKKIKNINDLEPLYLKNPVQ